MLRALPIVVVVMVIALGAPAAATPHPAPIRLAHLFDRPEWAPDPDDIGRPPWHVVDRTER